MSDRVYAPDEIRSIARSIARRYDIAALYLFGFCALKGKAGKIRGISKAFPFRGKVARRNAPRRKRSVPNHILVPSM